MERQGAREGWRRERRRGRRKTSGGVDCCSEVDESAEGARARCKVKSEDIVRWPKQRVRPLKIGCAR